VLNRINCDVLLHHFDALERGIRQAYLAGELLKRLIAALLFEEIRELLSKLVTHVRSVPQLESHIWDKSPLRRCGFGPMIVATNHDRDIAET
jgi:hypothetical protein